MAICKKCNQEGLVWKQSKKGKWYLSEPATISTKSAYKYITIPFAHKCKEVEQVYEAGFGYNGRNESFLINLMPSSGA